MIFQRYILVAVIADFLSPLLHGTVCGAVIDKEIELRRASKGLTASIVDLAVIGAGLGFSDENPVEERVRVKETGAAASNDATWGSSEDRLGDLEERAGLDDGNAEASLS